MDKDHEGGEVFPTMHYFSDEKKRKLNYVIHNPNTVEETARVLLEVFMQANTGKVERRLQKSLESLHDEVDHFENDAGQKVRLA